MGLRDRSRAMVEGEFARAAAAGHAFGDFVQVRRGTSGSNAGNVAACSCGWASTPRGRKVVAASAAYWHVLEVCAALDDRRRLDLVEWSDAPASPALRNGVQRARQGSDTPS